MWLSLNIGKKEEIIIESTKKDKDSRRFLVWGIISCENVLYDTQGDTLKGFIIDQVTVCVTSLK